MEKLNRRIIEWGMAAHTLAGQPESGDRYVVQFFPNGALVAVVDGLGHGQEAAAAAKIAAGILELRAGESLVSLVKHCHRALRETRGVVMSLASFDASEHTMTWLGVGNVEGLLLHGEANCAFSQELLCLRGGVVGHHLPYLYTSVIRLTAGDTLIFATDGIRGGFERGLPLGGPPQPVADCILAKSAIRTDDALALVVRYVNGT